MNFKGSLVHSAAIFEFKRKFHPPSRPSATPSHKSSTNEVWKGVKCTPLKFHHHHWALVRRNLNILALQHNSYSHWMFHHSKERSQKDLTISRIWALPTNFFILDVSWDSAESDWGLKNNFRGFFFWQFQRKFYRLLLL